MNRAHFNCALRLCSLGLAALVLAQPGSTAEPVGMPPASSRQVDFATSIVPIFRDRCYGCHSEAQQMGGLRLDRGEDALQGGNSGAVILPGHSANSKLVQMVAGFGEGSVMPLVGERLTREQIGILRAWIDQGADWTEGVTTESFHAKSPRIALVLSTDSPAGATKSEEYGLDQE